MHSLNMQKAQEANECTQTINQLQIQLQEAESRTQQMEHRQGKEKDKLRREIKAREGQYRTKLIQINQDLEQIDKRKHKTKEKLYQMFQ